MSATKKLLLLARGAVIGWIAMLIVWSGDVFLMPHRIESEIGPFGAFFVFGLVFSAMYLVNFLVITVPIYFLSLEIDRESAVPNWLPSLFGSGLFLLSVVVWCRAYNTRAEWHLYVLAAIAGATSVYAVSPSHSSSRKLRTDSSAE
jgi:hypothetical protein